MEKLFSKVAIWWHSKSDNEKLSIRFSFLILVVTGLGIWAEDYFGLRNLVLLKEIVKDIWSNLGTELISIVITITIIQNLADKRELARLVDNIKSPHYSFRDEAFVSLEREGWNKSGALKNLSFADLRWVSVSLHGYMLLENQFYSSDFEHLELIGTKFIKSQFRSVYFDGAEIRGCSFAGSDLERSSFVRANFVDVIFDGATLSDVNFDEADLRQVSFRNAKMELAALDGPGVRIDVTMPNGDVINTSDPAC